MKDIMLRIIGKQINRHNEIEDDEIEFVTQARAYRKRDALYVVYNELEMSGMHGMKVILRISDNGEVKLKRFSADEITGNIMKFSKGCRFNGFYETPAGTLPMEILTNSIEEKLDKELFIGSLHIDYDVALKGLVETRTLLTIELSDISNHSDCTYDKITPVYAVGEDRFIMN